MTTNHLFGLISSICLGLVILWTLFRKDKKTDYSKSVDCIEGPGHKVFQKPFFVQWGNGPVLEYANDWEINPDTNTATHSKVLEDIKKVEEHTHLNPDMFVDKEIADIKNGDPNVSYRMGILDFGLMTEKTEERKREDWELWDTVSYKDKGKYNEELCMKCGSASLSEQIDLGGSWAFEYKCLACGCEHLLNIPDAMGSYGAVPEIHYNGHPEVTKFFAFPNYQNMYAKWDQLSQFEQNNIFTNLQQLSPFPIIKLSDYVRFIKGDMMLRDFIQLVKSEL